MITSDERKWAEANNTELYNIAKTIWSKKFTKKQLISFQLAYAFYESRIQLNTADDYKRFLCYENMWQCAEFALGILENGR